MTTDTAGTDGSDPMEDAEAWQELDHEEQSAILDEGLDDLRGESGDGSFRHLDEADQAATVGAIERNLSKTEEAMEAALNETWTAELWQDLDEVPTVPFECRELSAHEQEVLRDAAGVVIGAEDMVAEADEDIEDADDLDALDLDAAVADSDHFDSIDDVEDWVPRFLADVTVDDAFGEERFRTGRRLRTNTRKLLFIEVFLRYQEEAERAVRFRAE